MASIATPMPGAGPSASSAPIESGRDLLSMVPADIMSGEPADTSSDEEENGAETFETPDEIPADADPVEEDAPVADPVAEEDATPEAPKETPKPESIEELPEGVKKGKDRNGKEGYFLEENRYKTFHGNHKLIQDLSGVLGEPATLEALSLRNEAYRANEEFFSNANSGDPKLQSGVINYIFDEMARAQKEGEVGVDPSVSFAKSFYENVKEKSPVGYASLRMQAARDLAEELFFEGAEKGDDGAYLAAQHMVRVLTGFDNKADMPSVRAAAQKAGLPFYSTAEAAGLKQGPKVDPMAALRAENELLKSKVNGGSTDNQAAQFGEWTKSTNTAIHSGIRDKALKPALEGVAKSWEKFPTEYQELVVDRLHRKVDEVMGSDEKFKGNIANLRAQAKRAVSAQVRAKLADQIETAYVHRAEQALDGVKKPILEFAATWLKDRSDQTHARRENAQTRTTPKGAGGAVPRSLIPNDMPQFKNGMFDRDTAMKQLASILK